MPDAERQRRTVIAGGTAWLTRMVQAAISMGTAIVLARLLTPDAFGVFAMVVPLGVIANQLAGQSFQTALLQRVGLAPDEVRGFFRFAIRANLAIAVLMVLAGFGLAWFFDEPRVRAVAAAWALATWLLTITAFQEAMLKRELRFPVV
ncbi:MAG TPA: oligosaccharide flippase family protein, partial [Gemmatimonadaceae bacterium]|nr:oligosaccharide flippase family protein [Gemmatimonadaceae bacterium]